MLRFGDYCVMLGIEFDRTMVSGRGSQRPPDSIELLIGLQVLGHLQDPRVEADFPQSCHQSLGGHRQTLGAEEHKVGFKGDAVLEAGREALRQAVHALADLA